MVRSFFYIFVRLNTRFVCPVLNGWGRKLVLLFPREPQGSRRNNLGSPVLGVSKPNGESQRGRVRPPGQTYKGEVSRRQPLKAKVGVEIARKGGGRIQAPR